MSSLFQNVPSAVVQRSQFNLSYAKKMSMKMGLLYPILHEEVLPSDVWQIGFQFALRFLPLIAPVLHEINAIVHYYFVPYRMLWPTVTDANGQPTDGWEVFITGGQDGNNVSAVLPRWTPTLNAKGTLWDYCGFPVGVVPSDVSGTLISFRPLDFIRRAYNLIYNEYYRDESIVLNPIALTNEAILKSAWEKDYFTASLLTQQRGTPLALPVSGTTHAVWPAINAGGGSTNFTYSTADQHPFSAGTKTALELNTIDLSTATTFNVADLRRVFQIQIWMERNSRCGYRYVEFLGAHFNVSPRDETLQRPVYIGGAKVPCIVSEVLQTSKTDTSPQGNMAGHGISVSRDFIGTYHAREYGIIVGILKVMPRASYSSQGINRQWLRASKYDFPFPEFTHLSEQAVLQGEIYADTTASHNNVVFGFQGMYDECRFKPDIVCGDMRDTFDYWHCSRKFSAAPVLNQAFIECDVMSTGGAKRIFAEQTLDHIVMTWGNMLKVYRPLPVLAIPGRIDH